MTSSPGPQPVGQSLGRVAGRLGAAPPGVDRAVEQVWETAVGPLAQSVRFNGLRNGAIVVDVADPAVREELRWRSEAILEKVVRHLLEQSVSEGLPTGIVVRTGGRALYGGVDAARS